jgi:hypothetical protein
MSVTAECSVVTGAGDGRTGVCVTLNAVVGGGSTGPVVDVAVGGDSETVGGEMLGSCRTVIGETSDDGGTAVDVTVGSRGTAVDITVDGRAGTGVNSTGVVGAAGEDEADGRGVLRC